MDDAVLDEDVRLDDLSSGVARRDILSGRIGGEVEVFSAGGSVSGTVEAGTIDRGSVNDVVPQNSPKRGLVARDLWNLLADGLVVGGEEGETADSGKILENGDVVGGVGRGVPDGNLRVLCEGTEP